VEILNSVHIHPENALDWYRLLAAMVCFIVVGMAGAVVYAYERHLRGNPRRKHVIMVGTGTWTVYAGAGAGELLLIGTEYDTIAWFIASMLIVSASLVIGGLYLILKQMVRNPFEKNKEEECRD
jgi:peptidoglycan/LPS O-acetylase OafA/YrhL